MGTYEDGLRREIETAQGQRVSVSVTKGRVWLECNDPEIGLRAEDLRGLLERLEGKPAEDASTPTYVDDGTRYRMNPDGTVTPAQTRCATCNSVVDGDGMGRCECGVRRLIDKPKCDDQFECERCGATWPADEVDGRCPGSPDDEEVCGGRLRARGEGS